LKFYRPNIFKTVQVLSYNYKMNSVTSMLLLLLFISCNNSPASQEEKIILPNTPETVSKQWQVHLDKNEIEEAAALSTTLTKEWLAENKELFLNDPQLYQTKFVKMNCTTEGEKAICNYTILEEGELIEDFFLLKKVDGQWLVDLEEEMANPELDEQIFKAMEKELKLD